REAKVEPKINVVSPSAPKKSIAVLPFENLSDDKANVYFADGIQEEILTRLSRIADLRSGIDRHLRSGGRHPDKHRRRVARQNHRSGTTRNFGSTDDEHRSASVLFKRQTSMAKFSRAGLRTCAGIV